MAIEYANTKIQNADYFNFHWIFNYNCELINSGSLLSVSDPHRTTEKISRTATSFQLLKWR
jgi:hypothetical protein